MNTNSDLWRKAFDILLSKGDVYQYDYEAAINELNIKGFSIALHSKEPETVHGNEAEKVVNGETFYCRFCDDKFTDEYDLEAHVKFHH